MRSGEGAGAIEKEGQNILIVLSALGFIKCSLSTTHKNLTVYFRKSWGHFSDIKGRVGVQLQTRFPREKQEFSSASFQTTK